MSAARKYSSQRSRDSAEKLGVPTVQQASVPAETSSTVFLKTLMEIKEDIGGIKSDIQKLNSDIKDVKDKQRDIDKAISSIKTVSKTLVSLGGIFALIRYWPDIMAFLQK